MTDDIVARYRQATEILEGHAYNQLVMNDMVLPHWIADSNSFWYERATPTGKSFRLVDAEAASNEPAFDHEALARALASASGQKVDHANLPIGDVSIALSPTEVRVKAFDKHWLYTADDETCSETSGDPNDQRSPYAHDPSFTPMFLPPDQHRRESPDGRRAVFVRDNNLWLVDKKSGEEKPLTTDATADFGYSSKSLGIDTAVQALWSPDSSRLFVVRRDTRKVSIRHRVDYVPDGDDIRPQLVEQRLAWPGDENLDSFELAAINVDTGQITPADYATVPLVRCGALGLGFFRARLGWWSPDSRHACFVHIPRDGKTVRVVRWDTHTGATRVLFEEHADTLVRLNHEVLDPFQFLPLPETNELIWFSERSGRAHLYLYKLDTGELVRPLTQGEWLVRDVLHFDAESRELLFQTAGRDPGISPYYRDICKVNIDSGELTTLVSGNFEHMVPDYLNANISSCLILGHESGTPHGISPCGRYLVLSRSRVDTIPETLLMDRNGRIILTLETADVSRLPDNWQWPEPVRLKGADGETEICGVVFRPPGFSPNKSYPVVEYSNSGRWFSGFPQGSFYNSQQTGFVYYFASAIAALGFVVVSFDGRGIPMRQKSFSDFGYGDPSLASHFPDRIAAIRELAERHPYMDLERMGVVSPEHPTNTIFALLKHSDFYKVCVQHCPTDPRFGLPTDEALEGTLDKDILNAKCYPEHYADALSGKLFFTIGMKSSTAMCAGFRLAEALQKANKDFEMLCMPRMEHEMTGYTIRREWDFLTRHLQGLEPPKGFLPKTVNDRVYETATDEQKELFAYDD